MISGALVFESCRTSIIYSVKGLGNPLKGWMEVAQDYFEGFGAPIQALRRIPFRRSLRSPWRGSGLVLEGFGAPSKGCTAPFQEVRLFCTSLGFLRFDSKGFRVLLKWLRPPLKGSRLLCRGLRLLQRGLGFL